MKLALCCDAVLKYPVLDFCKIDMRSRYHIVLDRLGYSGLRHKLNLKEFCENLIEYYSEEVLEKFSNHLFHKGSHKWIIRTIQGSGYCVNPLHHLLIIAFLGISIEEFMELPNQRQPFGLGPWPCLNRFCNDYKNLVITEVHLKYRNSRFAVGTFTCGCGFSYSKNATDITNSVVDENFYIKSYGDVFKAKLIEVWYDKEMHLAKKTEYLGISRRPLLSYAQSLGLPFPPPGSISKVTSISYSSRNTVNQAREDRRREYREKLEMLLQENASIKQREVIEFFGEENYNWFRNNDTMYVDEKIRYLARTRKRNNDSTRIVIDWNERDMKLVSKLEIVINEIKEEELRPKRITRSRIIRKLDMSDATIIMKYLEKLPKTSKIIAEAVETDIQFASRRIVWAKSECLRQNCHPNRTAFLRLAGVEHLVSIPIIAKAVDATLAQISLEPSAMVHGNMDNRRI